MLTDGDAFPPPSLTATSVERFSSAVAAVAGGPLKGGESSVLRSQLNISFFFALCCLGKIPGGAPFSQLHKGGKQSREDRP